METSETISKISPALLSAQKEMGNAVKDSKNPFFKTNYADLNSVREATIPHLNKHGVCVLQPTVYVDGKPFVKTLLLHESGEYIYSLTEIISDKQNNAQSHGSGVTYARRYGLQSMCNIGSEDDDGNAASGNVEAPKGKELKWLNLWTSKEKKDYSPEGKNAVAKLAAGQITMSTVKENYKLSKEVEEFLLTQIPK